MTLSEKLASITADYPSADVSVMEKGGTFDETIVTDFNS